MSLTRTKIDRNLSVEERRALVDWLAERSAQPTGVLVKQGLEELALWEKAGEPSHQSIADWIRKCWSFELERRRLAEDAEAARLLAAAAGSGHDLAAANAGMIQTILFDQLRTMRRGGEGDVELAEVNWEGLHGLVLSAARMMRSSQQERALQARLEQLERERVEAAKVLQGAAARGSISAETLMEVRRSLGLTA